MNSWLPPTGPPEEGFLFKNHCCFSMKGWIKKSKPVCQSRDPTFHLQLTRNGKIGPLEIVNFIFHILTLKNLSLKI